MHAGTGEEHAAEMCARMPLPVIGGFTQDEGIALGAMLSSGRGNTFLNLNESIHGFLLDNGVLLCCLLCLLFCVVLCACTVWGSRLSLNGSWASPQNLEKLGARCGTVPNLGTPSGGVVSV